MYPKELVKYFPDLGREIIVINGIGTDVQDRLNSQDLDSDTLYATNQPDIAELARKAYVEYPTIINNIPRANQGCPRFQKMCFTKLAPLIVGGIDAVCLFGMVYHLTRQLCNRFCNQSGIPCGNAGQEVYRFNVNRIGDIHILRLAFCALGFQN